MPAHRMMKRKDKGNRKRTDGTPGTHEDKKLPERGGEERTDKRPKERENPRELGKERKISDAITNDSSEKENPLTHPRHPGPQKPLEGEIGCNMLNRKKCGRNPQDQREESRENGVITNDSPEKKNPLQNGWSNTANGL